jgi:2',3'-cyclic-nucleotide 3'-phosphodiesterase
MPGSSLWLVPPADHPITNILSSLIKKTTTHFHSPHLFIPHVTLTSNINPSSHSGNPQQWLDALDLPKGEHVVVRFGNLQSEDAFFKKLYINVDKIGVQELGMRARQTVEGFEEKEKAREWAENEYKPHNSLL